MTAYRVTIASPKDISEVTIVCKGENCGTRTTVHVETAIAPTQCPSCNKAFDDDLKTALAALQRFQRSAKATKSTIEFQITEPPQQSPEP